MELRVVFSELNSDSSSTTTCVKEGLESKRRTFEIKLVTSVYEINERNFPVCPNEVSKSSFIDGL